MSSIGQQITIDEMQSIIPQNFKNYANNNPFYLKANDSMTNIIEKNPIRLNNGSYYWGNWNQNCEMEGPGKMYLINEKAYVEGLWKAGELKEGRLLLEDGSVYIGQIDNATFNGKGQMLYSDGRKYIGDFLDGLEYGNGTMEYPDKSIYKGTFKDGEMSGKGEFTWSNSCNYKGEFQNNTLKGSGVLTLSNGDTYSGLFDKNYPNDKKGCFTWKTGEKYTGGYVCGIKEGDGKYEFTDGNYFYGQWEEGVMNGEGEFVTQAYIYNGVWRGGEVIDVYANRKKRESSLTMSTESQRMATPEEKEMLNFQPLKEDFNMNDLGHLALEKVYDDDDDDGVDRD